MLLHLQLKENNMFCSSRNEEDSHWLSEDKFDLCSVTSTLSVGERETEPWARLICPSGTETTVLFVLFLSFQAVSYKKG